jgi:hypothetical protein
MSKHYVKTKTNEGVRVEVQMGWDRPMQWFYCVVSPILENNECDDPIYSNLNESDPEILTLKYYAEVLRTRFGITIPQDMTNGILEDRKTGKMNHAVIYEAVES